MRWTAKPSAAPRAVPRRTAARDLTACPRAASPPASTSMKRSMPPTCGRKLALTSRTRSQTERRGSIAGAVEDRLEAFDHRAPSSRISSAAGRGGLRSRRRSGPRPPGFRRRAAVRPCGRRRRRRRRVARSRRRSCAGLPCPVRRRSARRRGCPGRRRGRRLPDRRRRRAATRRRTRRSSSPACPDRVVLEGARAGRGSRASRGARRVRALEPPPRKRRMR